MGSYRQGRMAARITYLQSILDFGTERGGAYAKHIRSAYRFNPLIGN
jgi:hypothetical protein